MPVNVEVSEFAYNLEVNGCFLFEEVVPPELCEKMKKDVFEHYEKNREFQIAAGLGTAAKWGAHHICGLKNGIHDFLEADFLHSDLTAYFDGKPYILNSIGASINPPAGHDGSYEHGHKWHRDVRTFAGNGKRQLAVMIVMLDDFTIENGATEVLLGTHHAEAFPSGAFIKNNQRNICGKRGSLMLYDGDIWHRAGHNRTDKFRVGLTCVFTRPYFKQQMDYPRYLPKEYAEGLSPRMRQLFGFNAKVPSSIQEWYQPAGERFYKADQE